MAGEIEEDVWGAGSTGNPHGERLRMLLLAPQPYFQERGTPIAVRTLLDVLVTRGYRIKVLTYPEGVDTGDAAYSIERVSALPGLHGVRPGFSGAKLALDAVMMARAIRLCRSFRPHVVHAVEEGAFIAMGLKRLFGVPYIYDMDSSLPQQLVEQFPKLRPASPLLRRFERAAVRGSLGVLAVCRSLEDVAREYAPGQFIRRVEDITLIGEPAASGEDLKATTGRDLPIVLYVGNLEPYQGVQLLLEGYRLAAQSHPSQLIIIGGSPEHVRAYREGTRHWGLEGSIHFLGPRDLSNLGWYLAQADVLASPRVAGTNTPMKIYSYLDSGTAVLATRLPTHTQVLDDSIACLVDPTPESVADGLGRLLGDSALRGRLAAAAAERVRQEFTREAFARKVHAFYARIEARLPAQTRQ